MSQITRRDFLAGSAMAAMGLAAQCAGTRILGVNEDVRIGIIGVGSKGSQHAKHVTEIAGARLVALADPDPEYTMLRCREELSNLETPVKVDVYTDFRRMLDRKDIDAVIIASPNHWHAHHAMYAIQAGKHVYVEKPVSHDIWQGRQLARMAGKSGLVVQSGLQHRSRKCWPEVMDYLDEGHLGKIICARGLCYKRRKSIGLLKSAANPPASCDYDLWLGPARDLPLMRSQFHYDWHWVWNTGNGDLGNQGCHQLDIARWIIGETKCPERIYSIGGRFGYKDAGETANTQIVCYDYKPVPLIFEVRGLPEKPDVEGMSVYKQSRISTIVECEGGFIAEDTAYDNKMNRIHRFTGHGSENHLPAFIKAIRDQRPESVPCSIEDGHISTALAHLGNISHRTGSPSGLDKISERVVANPLQQETWERTVNHLMANNVDLNVEKATLGAMLTFDPDRERFNGQGSEKANALLKDEYRKNWKLPRVR